MSIKSILLASKVLVLSNCVNVKIIRNGNLTKKTLTLLVCSLFWPGLNGAMAFVSQINPDADVTVGPYAPNGYGSDLRIHSVPAQAWSILEFDVSEYSSGNISNLTLNWYHHYRWGGGTAPMPVSVYEYGEAVQESNIYGMNWNNYDANNPIDSGSFNNLNPAGDGVWNSLTLIGDDADSPIDITGNDYLRLVLRSTSVHDLGWNMVFYSKDFQGDFSLWPYLEVEASVPETATMWLMGIGLVGLLATRTRKPKQA